MKSLKALLSTLASLTPVARTASANGVGVDLANFASNEVNILPGVLTDGVHTPKLQESDVLGSGYTDVAAADQDGTLGVLVTDTEQSVAYIGIKRYVRVVITVTGGPATGAVCGAYVTRGNARKVPV